MEAREVTLYCPNCNHKLRLVAVERTAPHPMEPSFPEQVPERKSYQDGHGFGHADEKEGDANG